MSIYKNRYLNIYQTVLLLSHIYFNVRFWYLFDIVIYNFHANLTIQNTFLTKHSSPSCCASFIAHSSHVITGNSLSAMSLTLPTAVETVHTFSTFWRILDFKVLALFSTVILRLQINKKKYFYFLFFLLWRVR